MARGGRGVTIANSARRGTEPAPAVEAAAQVTETAIHALMFSSLISKAYSHT